MFSRRTALAIFSALLVAVLQARATSYPRSIVPVAGATASEAAAEKISYGRIVRMALTDEEMAAAIDFDIVLKLQNREGLEARVNRGEVLSRTDLEAYLPTTADYARVRAWLVAQGFAITLDSDSRHAVFARGSNARVAAAFGVQLARVTTGDGEFTSAVSAPSLPDEIGAVVSGIRGLQPHLIRHPHSRRPQQLVGNAYADITPAAVAAVYNAPTNLDGTGQTIAVIAASIPGASDLISFRSECGIWPTGTNLTTINIMGGPGSSTSDQQEASMDVEWASGLAPQAAIRLYATPSPLGDTSEAAAYTQILNDLPSNPTLHQVTESYGGLEADYGGGDSSLLLLVAQGVTCFASSGDGGSNPDESTGVYKASAALAISYPASDPSMTAVGGTTLIFPDSGQGTPTLPEVAWSLTTYQGTMGATGGGISALFSRPSWQVAAGMPAGGKRCIPDVSALAYTGSGDNDLAPIIFSGGTAYSGGGTSLSSPIWAGLCALINQSRASANLSPVGFLNPKIYPAAGSSSFTDITSGNNGAYSAGTGYDLCTGLGTPSVTNLIAYLSKVPQLPWFVSQPQSVTDWVGQTEHFYVTIGGYPVSSCQWQVSTNTGASWSNLANASPYSGTTTTTLTITGVTAGMNHNQYRCVATNPVGSVNSKAATLSLYGAPSFSTAPQNETALEGAATSFTAYAFGSPNPTFQWQVSTNAGVTWSNLTDTAHSSGTTTNTLTISGVTLAMNGYEYRCLASNAIQANVTSGVAVLTAIAGTPGSLWNTGEIVWQGYTLTVPELLASDGVAAVAAGGWHALFLKTDGSLWGAGYGAQGQLGTGTTSASYTPPLQIVAGGVQAFAAGGYFSLFVKSDGSLWAMGADDQGQLGDGKTSMQQLTPEKIIPSGVQSVAAGAVFSLVLKTDGSLWAMGDNTGGQLGDGTTTRRLTPEMILPGGVQSVAAGHEFSLILKTDGSLWAMGDNSSGQLGDGTTSSRSAPEKILSGGVQAIAAGYNSSLVLKTDGSLWAMGDNTAGELGDGTTTQRLAPKMILSSGVQAIAAGEEFSMFIKADGTLWAMGLNYEGELGDGTTTGRFMPELIAANVNQVAAGESFSLFVVGFGITSQPVSQVVTAGGTASFRAAAAGNPAPTYQWQVSTNGGSTWTNLTNTGPYSGATTGTLTIAGATTSLNSFRYRCVASSGTSPTATSHAAALTVNKAVPVIAWPALAAIPSGTALSATQLNAKGSVPGAFVYSPAAGTVLSANTYTLKVTFTPTDAANYAAVTATQTLVVSGKTIPVITWPAPAAIAYGKPLSATQLNATASVPGTFVYTPAAGTVLNAGTQLLSVAFTPTNTTAYAATAAPQTLVVNKAAQSINFPAPGNKTYGSAPFAVWAAATNGQDVTFSVVSGPAKICWNTVILTGAGTVTVRASQAGNANYNAATPVDHAFTVAKAPQTITFGAPGNKVYGAAPFNLSGSASSGLALTFSVLSGPATISGKTVTITGVGTVILQASQAGNANYLAATPVSRSFTVAKAPQTITFGAPGNKVYGAAPFNLSGSASSGLALTFSVLSGPATISGRTVTLTGAGTVILQASQAGNANYLAATPVSHSFTVTNAKTTATADSKVAGPSNEDFLRQLFLEVLGRQATAGELGSIGAAMSAGESRADVLGELLGSAEYSRRQIDPAIRLYYAAFARMTSYSDLQACSSALAGGNLTVVAAADKIAASAEFLRRYGALDNTQYVRQLYSNVFGREADAAVLGSWVGRLDAGTSRGSVLAALSQSAEFKADAADPVEILRLYFVLLHRIPTTAELQGWEDFLQGGGHTDTAAPAQPDIEDWLYDYTAPDEQMREDLLADSYAAP